MTYIPDIKSYQQLADPITGAYDCTAYATALVTDADTMGRVKLTGREIRKASNEPVPNPVSPGLNLTQTRDAVVSLTDGAVRLTLEQAVSQAQAQAQVAAGRYAVVQINRGVLVNRGIVRGFAGGHAVSLNDDHGMLWMGDPLIPYYVRLTWDDIWAAASAFSGVGKVNALVSKIVGDVPVPTDDLWSVNIHGGTANPTDIFAKPNGVQVGRIYTAHVTAHQSKVAGHWWYQIVSAQGDATKYEGRWFAAHGWMDAVKI